MNSAAEYKYVHAYTLRAANFITARTILTGRNVYVKRILATDTHIYTPIAGYT